MSPLSLGVIAASKRRAASPGGQFPTHRGTWSLDAGATQTVPIGDPTPTRTVIVVAVWATNLVRSITALTIGGVEATLDVDDTTNRSGVAVWRATVPTGTTASVVPTFNSNVPYAIAVLTAPGLAVIEGQAAPVAVGSTTATVSAALGAGRFALVGAASGETTLALTPSGTRLLDETARRIDMHTGESPVTITVTLAAAATDPARNPLALVTYAAA